MFKNTYQNGFLSILYSVGSKPLQIWESKVKNGHIKRITDDVIQSLALEIMGNNVMYVSDKIHFAVILSFSFLRTTYITCPVDTKKTLGIKLPYFVMIIRNMKKYFTFEVQV